MCNSAAHNSRPGRESVSKRIGAKAARLVYRAADAAQEEDDMRYQITTTDGRQHPALRREYATEDEAVEALRGVMGWTGVHLSDRYQVGPTTRSGMARSAYETYEEREEDETGAYAPRVIEIATEAS